VSDPIPGETASVLLTEARITVIALIRWLLRHTATPMMYSVGVLSSAMRSELFD